MKVGLGPTFCMERNVQLFLLFRCKEHLHPFSFELRKLFHFSELFQFLCETEEKDLSLFFEDDGTSAEHHVCFHFRTFFKETNSVILLEIEIMIVCMRTETNLFHNDFRRFRLHLFLLLLLFVEELLVIHYAAHRRIGTGYDFHEIKPVFFGDLQRFGKRVDSRFNSFSYETDLCYVTDLFVDTMKFFFYSWSARATLKRWAGSSAWSWRKWWAIALIRSCDFNLRF